jgi:hypothetical protein
VTWFKVDDGFHSHPKVLDLSLAAVGLWTLAGSWCSNYLTDGQISERTIFRLGGSKDLADELVASGLWSRTDEGFHFNDWSDYQPSKAAVMEDRDAARLRMANYRAKRRENSSENVRPNEQRTSDEVQLPRPDPTRPDPSIVPNGTISARSSSSTQSSRRSPARPIPENFAPNEAHITYSKEKSIDLKREFETFCNHARANDRRQADWNASFRVWLSKAKPIPGSMQASVDTHEAIRRMYGRPPREESYLQESML